MPRMRSEYSINPSRRKKKKSLIIEQLSEDMRSVNSLRRTPQFFLRSSGRIDMRVIREMAQIGTSSNADYVSILSHDKFEAIEEQKSDAGSPIKEISHSNIPNTFFL